MSTLLLVSGCRVSGIAEELRNCVSKRIGLWRRVRGTLT